MKEKRILLTRQNDDDDGSIVYNYPYDTLPRLRSHLHPKFVIFNTGKKLRRALEGIILDPELQRLNPNLVTILRVYDAWILPLPVNAMDDVTYVDPHVELVSEDDGNPDDDPNDLDYRGSRTNRTPSGRGDGHHLRPRTRSVAASEQHDKGGDPERVRPGTRKEDRDNLNRLGGNTRAKGRSPVKKRKVFSESAHNQQFLSEASLSRHNRQFGEAPWTACRIRHWSKTFPKKRKLVSRV
jgi:hypothetical protein